MGQVYLGEDPTTGKHVYAESTTGTKKLSDEAPSANTLAYTKDTLQPTGQDPNTGLYTYTTPDGKKMVTAQDLNPPPSPPSPGISGETTALPSSVTDTQGVDGVINPEIDTQGVDGVITPEVDKLDGLKGDGKRMIGPAAADAAPPTRAEQETPVVSNQNPPLDSTPKDLTRPNILHKYSSYTYNLSLHALSPNDYNAMIETGKYSPKHVLIASAGRRGVDFKRDPLFEEDFFFEKLNMETVIGMSPQARNANAIKIDFTIIEPYGMTLLNRIMGLEKVFAKEITTPVSYLTIPYLIQIDFFGYNKDGIPEKLKDNVKYIPIRIATMSFKVTNKGAEYEISAYPYNHQAFAETVATVPFKLEVTAGTVGEFFAGLDGSTGDYEKDKKLVTDRIADDRFSDSESTRIQRELTAENKAIIDKHGEDGNLRDANVLIKMQDNKMLIDSLRQRDAAAKGRISTISVRNYPAAINAWQQQLMADGHSELPPYQIYFEFDPEIRDAAFQDKANIQASASAMTLAGQQPQVDENVKVKLFGEEGKTPNVMSLNAGQSVLEVIAKVIKNSSYIWKQVLDVNNETELITKEKLKEFLEKPLQWYKVIPKIVLGSYIPKIADYEKFITYQVKKHTVYNTKNEEAHMGAVKHYIKKYDYIFTGKNQDIINFDLTFDALYFTTATANQQATAAASQAQNVTGSEVETKEQQAKKIRALLDQILSEKIKGSVSLETRKVFVSQQVGSSLTEHPKADIVASIDRNLLSSAQGDMIGVKLKIIGDPDFIKQDDIFYNPKILTESREILVNENGSIKTDDGSVYVMLTFNTAGDYDKTTGLVQIDKGKNKISAFSGVYQVVTVSNSFSGGKFEQELNLFRHPNQPPPGVEKKAVSSDAERGNIAASETYASRLAGGLPALPNASPAAAISAEAESASNDVERMGVTGNENTVDEPVERPYADVKDAPVESISEGSGTGTIPIGPEPVPPNPANVTPTKVEANQEVAAATTASEEARSRLNSATAASDAAYALPSGPPYSQQQNEKQIAIAKAQDELAEATTVDYNASKALKASKQTASTLNPSK